MIRADRPGTEKIEEIEPIEITPEMIEAAVYELK